MSDEKAVEERFSNELQSVRSDIGDIRISVSKIADAMTRLAVLEERGVATNQLLEKLINRQEKIEERQHAQDFIQASNKQVADKVTVLESEVRELKEEVRELKEAEIARSASIKTVGTVSKVFWAVAGGIMTLLIWKLITLTSASPSPISIPQVH